MIKNLTIILLFVNLLFSEKDLIINQNSDHHSIKTVFVLASNCEEMVSVWEENLLKVGYNVVTRDKINILLEEQKLSMSGITNNIRIGELIGADAILYVESKVNDSKTPNHFAQKAKIQFISVMTGEILMIGSYFDAGSPEKVLESGHHWTNSVLPEYQKKIKELSSKQNDKN